MILNIGPSDSLNYKFNNYHSNTVRNDRDLLTLKNDKVSFSGMLYSEKNLIHETALFRDLDTKRIVVDYIKKNFVNKEEISVLVGACSTGEEAFTYSMLLKDLGKKVNILGFDVSQNVIDSANNRQITMLNLRNEKGNEDSQMVDSFLCFKERSQCTKIQQELKKLFDEYFELSGYKKIRNFTFANICNVLESFLEPYIKYRGLIYDKGYAILKDGKANNCKFVVGDILELDKINDDKNVDVFTFSNALYHLLIKDVRADTRVLKENADDVMRSIAIKIKEKLNPNGILVLGEKENLQMLGSEIVPETLSKLGFTSIFGTSKAYPSVWKVN